jgi:hypothetical protein
VRGETIPIPGYFWRPILSTLAGRGRGAEDPRVRAAFALVAVCVLGDLPPPAKGPEAEFMRVCKQTCTRSQMMRAVGAGQIDAECERSCGAEWVLPACRNSACIAKHTGERVRVFGKLSGDILTLERGAKLRVVVDPRAAAGLEGKAVVAAGTVKTGEKGQPLTLEEISAIAPSDGGK